MKEKSCSHCHTLFVPTSREPDFCCAGCRFVNQLLIGEGLNHFYQLQDGQTGRPVGDRPFESPKTDWLESLIARQEELDEPQLTLSLRISGVTCVGCVWLIEKFFLDKTGAARATIYPATAEAEFTFEKNSPALLELARELPRYGYILEDPTTLTEKKTESKKLLPRLGLSAAFAMNTMAFSLPRYLGMNSDFSYARLFDLISLISSTFALLIGGSYFFIKAAAAIKHRSIHIDLPIALGLALAYLGSLVGWLSGEAHLIYFDFVATFTVLMVGGRYLHLAASERAQSQLQGQSAIAHEVILADGSRKPTENVAPTDQLTISPGQALPVASRLASHDTEFSLAWMTGEPDPRVFSKGTSIPAGAIPLGDSPIQVEAEEAYHDSLIARLTRQEARHSSSESAQQILKYYLLTIIFIGLATGIGWLLTGQQQLRALQSMISVFIVSCPCAIGVAIPLVDRRAAATLARLGVFVQNPSLWSSLSRVRNLIFDKTGTLTLEHPELSNPEALNQLSTDAKIALQVLTQNSLHPLSRTLRSHLISTPNLPPETKVSSHSALGTSAKIDHCRWTLGKPGWRGQDQFKTLNTVTLACELAHDGTPVIIFHFHESLRPRALQALDSLSKSHRLHILSGDQSNRVYDIATTLKIPSSQAHGSLSPDEKATLVHSLKPALYLGDGMNDTLAFQAATVTGTPVADRSLLDRRSDFLFTCPGLSFLPTLFSLASWRRHTVGQILAFTIAYNIAAVSASILGHMTPLLAAILMPLSSLVSLLIAQRRITKAKK